MNKNIFNKKNAQTLVEFVLVGLLVGLVSFWALFKINPDFFRSYFRGSVSSSSGIDSNGQMELKSMDDAAAIPPLANCNSSVGIGALETDGSIYVGNVGGHDICVTPGDIGGSSWNNGTTSYFTTGVSSLSAGETNTTSLAALSATDSPYMAAVACNAYSALGHSDWYLPSYDEMSLIITSGVYAQSYFNSMNSCATMHNYWTSTEDNNNEAWAGNFYNNIMQKPHKNGNYRVLCIRHD